MSKDGSRLSDYPSGFPTEEIAQLSAYIGLEIYLSLTGESVIPFQKLEWRICENGQAWVDEYYQKSVMA